MRKSFVEAVRNLVYHGRSIDNHGFANHIPVTLLDELEWEYKSYCRKHGIRLLPRSPVKKGQSPRNSGT